MTWTDDVIQKLIELRNKGLTPRQIGAIFDCTRNSVIGKLNRLGVRTPNRQRIPNIWRSARNKSAMAKRKKPPIYSSSFKPAPLTLKREASMPAEPPAPHQMPPARATGADALLALRHGDCRWPIGDVGTPEFRFCGAPCERGFSYCEHHQIASTGARGRYDKGQWKSD